jgi:methionyl aminopeptidase
VIHGIPGKRRIAQGDLVSLDCGIDLGGFISDQALTIEAGRASEAAHRLNAATLESLNRGCAAVKSGDRLLQIARAVEGCARPAGYGIVSVYRGHGVGFDLHEDPSVPNTPHGPNPKMQGGLVIAIEPMVNMGSGEIEELEDGWTVVTADGSLSAHWEHTVAIHHDGTVERLTDDLSMFMRG